MSHVNTLKTMIHIRDDGQKCGCGECRALQAAITALSLAELGGVIYQCMCTDEDHIRNGPKDIWMDVDAESFTTLSQREDVRSRILYTTPRAAEAVTDPFAPHWPEGLKADEAYEFRCDDKGRDGGSWLRLVIAGDGDVWMVAQDWEDIKEEGTAPNPIPSLRCRTFNGGGRRGRTHQALLWLAQAIRLDNAALTPPSAKGENSNV